MTRRPYQPVQRQRAVDEGRERIVLAARALLEADDDEPFSIDAVARRAGVARMTVYNQFGSKTGLLEALFDLGVRGARALKITLVHHHDVSQIEHDDLLQLQPAPVIRIHHQDGKIDNPIFPKRHRFLPGADRFDNHIIEIGLRQQGETIMGCG